MDGDTSNTQVVDARELQKKLQMAQKEQEHVRAELTRQLEQVQRTVGRGVGWPDRTTSVNSAYG